MSIHQLDSVLWFFIVAGITMITAIVAALLSQQVLFSVALMAIVLILEGARLR